MAKAKKEAPVIAAKVQDTGMPKLNSSFNWGPVVVMALTALVYANAVTNGFTNFDDDFYVFKNPFLQDHSLQGIKAIFSSFYVGNYHPLTTLTYLFEYTFFGLNPVSYHLINVALHVLNAWLAYKVTEQLSGKQVTAFVVAVLFAIHPMHVESVAWVSERKDVLYAFFYLLSLRYYLKYLSAGYALKYFFIALLFFTASLLSKSAAVTLPVLLVAIDIYKGRKINARSLIEKAPCFILSIIFGIVALMSQKAGGAIRDLSASHTIAERFFIFSYGLASYIVRLVAPVGLSAMHYLHSTHGGALPWAYYASVPFLAVTAWLVARPSRYRKDIVFGVLFFLITISVMLQVIAVGSAITAERYTYIPYIGLFYIAGQWVANNINGLRKNIITGTGIIIILIFSALTWSRIGVWKDGDTLFTDAIAKDPTAYFGYWMRGNLKNSEGKYEEALQDYTDAIRLNPEFEDLYYDRGHASFETGNTPAAIKDYTKAIENNPKMAEAYNDRGWALYKSGDTAVAMADFSKAININPGLAEAYNNRGSVYYAAGNLDAALPDFDKAIALKPGYDLPYFNRAVLKANKREFKQALEDFDILITLKPENNAAIYSRGLVKYNLNDKAGACEDWQKAAQAGSEPANQLLQQYCH